MDAKARAVRLCDECLEKNYELVPEQLMKVATAQINMGDALQRADTTEATLRKSLALYDDAIQTRTELRAASS